MNNFTCYKIVYILEVSGSYCDGLQNLLTAKNRSAVLAVTSEKAI
jgi:hypothetical protein